MMPETIPPALRADRELSTAVDALLCSAAAHDGEDIIEANAALTWELLHRLGHAQLAAAAAMLALRLHRAGGVP